MVTLRSDETSHIVDIARHSDAVVLTIIAAAPDLVRLPIKPELRASARFGLVTLSQRQEAPALRIVRELQARTPGFKVVKHGFKLVNMH